MHLFGKCTFVAICLSAFVNTVPANINDKKPVTFAKLATCREFDINSINCEHFFQIANLKNYKSDKYKLFLKLYLLTSNDANFIINNGKTGAQKVEYVAVIGGFANSYSWLRKNEVTIGLDSNKIGILSPLWPTPVIIKQDYCGELEVSVPNVAEPLLKANAKDLDAKSICLYAYNTPGRWFYNCKEEEGQLPALNVTISPEMTFVGPNMDHLRTGTILQIENNAPLPPKSSYEVHHFFFYRNQDNASQMEYYESFNASGNVIDSLLLIPNGTQTASWHPNETLLEGSDVQRFFPITLTWSYMCLVIVFCVLIVVTIIGNTLVIIAVITTRRLRTVTNCFVMSLAVADLLVGIFVMPPAVALDVIGKWQLGWLLCDIWISLDVLLCTASILSLCAISVDRYLAVTRPLTYSRKRRSKRLALIMILVVWLLALAITCPPILGWYEPGRRENEDECRYNRNEGYVIFSAMGSFFIPMAVMVYVYGRISCVVASRHDNMTDIEVHNKKFKRYQQTEIEAELEQDVSEQDNPSPNLKKQAVRTLSNQTILRDPKEVQLTDSDAISRQCKNGNYELVTTSSRPSSIKRPASCLEPCRPVSSNSDHWSVGSRHSVRLQSAIVNESYVTRNTRVHQKSLSSRITSLKRENKTTQTLSIVVGGFIACWLPFFVNYLITPFLPDDYVSADLAKFFVWLGWFNSAINPFIYAYYSVDFRAAFWRLTFKRLFKNSSKGQYPSSAMSIRR